MFKFLHIICGTIFLGISIAEFFYIARSIHSSDRTIIDYSIKVSYFGDGAAFLCMLVLLITAARLVSVGHFTLAVSWIFVAYLAFGTIILLWLSNLFIKQLYFSKTNISPYAVRAFYFTNITMLFIFIIIIHDAVTQSTWFHFLFRR